MVTLIFSSIQQSEWGIILGYILSGCEILIVLLTLISYFVPSDTKFGRIISHILKGLYKSKQTLTDIKDKEEKEDDNDSNSKRD